MSGVFRVNEMPRRVLVDLKEWGKNVLGELEERIKNVRKELKRCRRSSRTQENVSREHLVQYKLERFQDQQHLYWKQRANADWLTRGERNTSFSMLLCRRGKELTQLKD